MNPFETINKKKSLKNADRDLFTNLTVSIYRKYFLFTTSKVNPLGCKIKRLTGMYF